MTKVLIIQGAGMNMRGKVQVDVFGTATLEHMNDQIKGYADALDIEIEIFHSNIEGEVVNALYDAHEREFSAAVINPAGYTTTTGSLRGAISQVGFPVIEVHVTNPTSRGTVSTVQPVCQASIYGFGLYGYALALEGIKNVTSP